MKKIDHILFTLVLLLAAAGVMPAAAQTPRAELSIIPGEGQTVKGEILEVGVQIKNVTDLYGMDMTLNFDPAVVEVVDANPGMDGVQVSLGTFLDPGMLLINRADNAAGRINFVMTQMNPSEAKSGSGLLLVVRLRGVKEGASSGISFGQVLLSTRDGMPVEFTFVDGVVSVSSTNPKGPAPTPMPVQDNSKIMLIPTAGPELLTQVAAALTPDPTPTMMAATPEPTLAATIDAQPKPVIETQTAGSQPEDAINLPWWVIALLAVLALAMAGVWILRKRQKKA